MGSRSVMAGLVGISGIIALALALPVVPLVAGLAAMSWVVERLARLVTPRRQVLSWPDVLTFDARLGFKMKPHLDCMTTPYATDPYHLETCAEGWPGRQSIAESEVLVVGDSMAAGQGVDARRSYYSAPHRGPTIKPVACPSYDLAQECLVIEDLARGSLAHKLVVWLIYTSNDLFEATRASMGRSLPTPYMRRRDDGTWEIGHEHIGGTFGRYFHGESGRFRSALAHANATALFYRPGWASERGFAAARYLLGRAADAVRSAGGTLAVVALPRQSMHAPDGWRRRRLSRIGVQHVEEMRTDYLDERMGQLCDEVGVGYTSGTKVFGFFDYLMVGDDHLSERGHRKLRRLLVRLHGDVTRAVPAETARDNPGAS